MTHTILLVAGLVMALSLFSQDKCDISKLSRRDKILLQQFLSDFKMAVNEKNKVKLSALCSFPLECDDRVVIMEKYVFDTNEQYVKVTKSDFETSEYEIFLQEGLRQKVNVYQSPEEFITSLQPFEKGKRCSYSIYYNDGRYQNPGLQVFFDIQKVKGQFKITTAWALP